MNTNFSKITIFFQEAGKTKLSFMGWGKEPKLLPQKNFSPKISPMAPKFSSNSFRIKLLFSSGSCLAQSVEHETLKIAIFNIPLYNIVWLIEGQKKKKKKTNWKMMFPISFYNYFRNNLGCWSRNSSFILKKPLKVFNWHQFPFFICFRNAPKHNPNRAFLKKSLLQKENKCLVFYLRFYTSCLLRRVVDQTFIKENIFSWPIFKFQQLGNII